MSQDTEPTTTIVPEDPSSINTSPFEGPEKLLEIWFASSSEHLLDYDQKESLGGKFGLRKVKRDVWEAMLDIVKCKVLSVVEGSEIDAYLLSESSFFVSPHKLILKTCGTTLNLLGLPRILEIAQQECGLGQVWRCFYSRKSFMFPERQLGPHREWKDEVQFLDKIFPNGSAYTVGKVNGDHWLLYLTTPPTTDEASPVDTPSESSSTLTHDATLPDFTLEILMSRLAAPARRAFFYPDDPNFADIINPSHAHGAAISSKLGIDSLFPASLTTLDAFAFEPCGYSSNALVSWGEGEGYYTIHVTPEEGWSYASFECNVPISQSRAAGSPIPPETQLPDLETLIQRVVTIFQPGHLSLSLFVSSDLDPSKATPIDTAQGAFKHALATSGYRRTDKINYEFDGYDLAFASFEKLAHTR